MRGVEDRRCRVNVEVRRCSMVDAVVGRVCVSGTDREIARVAMA